MAGIELSLGWAGLRRVSEEERDEVEPPVEEAFDSELGFFELLELLDLLGGLSIGADDARAAAPRSGSSNALVPGMNASVA